MGVLKKQEWLPAWEWEMTEDDLMGEKTTFEQTLKQAEMVVLEIHTEFDLGHRAMKEGKGRYSWKSMLIHSASLIISMYKTLY